MFDKMKELMEMKKQADLLKKNLDATNVETQEVSGIKIVINGSQNFQSIEIDQHMLLPENKINLERDLLRSLNASIKRSQEMAQERMKTILPGFGR